MFCFSSQLIELTTDHQTTAIMMFPIVRAPIKDQTLEEMGIKEAISWDRSCGGGSGGRQGRPIPICYSGMLAFRAGRA